MLRRGSIIEFPRKLVARTKQELKNHVSPVQFWPSAQAQIRSNLTPGLPGFDDVTIRSRPQKRTGGRPIR